MKKTRKTGEDVYRMLFDKIKAGFEELGNINAITNTDEFISALICLSASIVHFATDQYDQADALYGTQEEMTRLKFQIRDKAIQAIREIEITPSKFIGGKRGRNG